MAELAKTIPRLEAEIVGEEARLREITEQREQQHRRLIVLQDELRRARQESASWADYTSRKSGRPRRG